MNSEADVKAQVKLLCKKHGAYYVMPVAGTFGKAGVPDFLICHKGRFIGVETKFGKNKPTKLQLVELKEIREASGVALVINETNLVDLEAQLLA